MKAGYGPDLGNETTANRQYSQLENRITLSDDYIRRLSESQFDVSQVQNLGFKDGDS